MNTFHLVTLVLVVNLALGIALSPLSLTTQDQTTATELNTYGDQKISEYINLIEDDLNTSGNPILLQPNSTASDSFLEKIVDWRGTGDNFIGLLMNTVLPVGTLNNLNSIAQTNNILHKSFSYMLMLCLGMLNIAGWMRLYDKIVNKRAD